MPAKFNTACEQCGRAIDEENHAELHAIVAGEREALEFCNYACACKFMIEQNHSEKALKDFQSEVLE